ncbi:MAG: hemerythrin domain-containing protein [Streptosporangiaceae bacterium]|nr:hemerythrin domain-containing protein [Streptosporangiaceae bacterium]MBV9857262.1 hemerythrin domain-containing protein [Streptosporangiaceae bacterium]
MAKKSAAGTDRANLLTMLLAHRTFRKEFAALAREAATPHDPARGAALDDQLGLILRGLHLHHTGEDTEIWPLLLRRAPQAAPVLDAMEAEHHELDPLIAQAGDTSLPLTERAGVLSELSKRLGAHLDREEREALPLIERHIPAAEWAAIEERIMKKLGKDLPDAAGLLMWYASPEERREFFAGIPAILQLMYRLSWRRRYARRVARTYGGAAPAAHATPAPAPG